VARRPADKRRDQTIYTNTRADRARRTLRGIDEQVAKAAVRGTDHLAAIVRNRLKRIQYRPDLLTSFLTQTGLTLDAEPP